MVNVELIEQTLDYVRYKYYPEGKKYMAKYGYDFGIIQVDYAAQNPVLEKADNTGISTYRCKAYKCIREQLKNKQIRKFDGLAWY